MRDFKGYVYPPARATKVAVEEFDRRIKRKDAFDWGIAEMDRRIVPAVPGDLITILGRPGMGKTLLLIHLAKRFSGLIKDPKDVVVYATWETLVEEFVGILSSGVSGFSLENIARGQADITIIKKSLVSVLGTGIIVFGQSMENRENLDPPTLNELDAALAYLKGEGYNVRALLIDYAQAIPGLKERYSNNEPNKILSVSENVFFCKTLGKKYGVPVILGVQAKREVDNYTGLKFPTLNDGQWTAVIEQASDKIFGITMPAKYMKPGIDLVKLKGWVYEVDEMTFGIKMLKQRFGPVNSSDTWLLLLNPIHLTVEEHPTNGEDFEDDDVI